MTVTASGHAALRRTARALADGRLASQGVSMGDPVGEAYFEETTDLIAERLAAWIEDGCDPGFALELPVFEDRADEIRADLADDWAERMADAMEDL